MTSVLAAFFFVAITGVAQPAPLTFPPEKSQQGELTWFGSFHAALDISRWEIIKAGTEWVTSFDKTRIVRLSDNHHIYRTWFRFDFAEPQHFQVAPGMGSAVRQKLKNLPEYSQNAAEIEVDCAELSILVLGAEQYYDSNGRKLFTENDIPLPISRERQVLAPGEELGFDRFCKAARRMTFEDDP